jgi:hypothetical protein
MRPKPQLDLVRRLSRGSSVGTDNRSSRQQFTRGTAFPRLCLLMRLSFQKDVRFGSEADLVLRSIYVRSALQKRTRSVRAMKLLIGLEGAHAFR